jgi:hypothetical protein
LALLKGKEVEVDFHGTLYKGTLVDTSEDEVFLRTAGSLFTLPLNEISDIRAQYGHS